MFAYNKGRFHQAFPIVKFFGNITSALWEKNLLDKGNIQICRSGDEHDMSMMVPGSPKSYCVVIQNRDNAETRSDSNPRSLTCS